MVIDRLTKEIDLCLPDGRRLPADIDAEEDIEGNETNYIVAVRWDGRTVVKRSKDGFFGALKRVRLELEKDGLLLHCFGASKNVHQSGMQASMGPGILAYRLTLGRQALSEDVVNIFDSDEN